MRNPFVSYSPLESQNNWIGDTNPFIMLSHNMRMRNNVCILGVQGTGKTSLLQCFFNIEYIRRMAQDEKTIICSVDLSLQQSGSDVCQYLADRIKSTARLLLIGSPYYQMFIDALKAEDATTPQALLQNIIGILNLLGYHVVLIMDRFERFTSSTTITMGHHETLRSLIEANMLRCIVATNYDLSKDSLAPGVKGSYLMQKFTNHICLKGMPQDVAVQYIQNQQLDSKIQLPNELIAKLTEISGGIPLLLEYAAESAYDNLSKNEGKINGRELTAEIYEKSRPVLRSWCDSLTAAQIRVLKTLTNESSNNMISLFDFTGFDDDIKKAVAALRWRGLLIAPDVEYNFEVRANSLLLQRFCKEELKEPESQLIVPQAKDMRTPPLPMPDFSSIPSSGATVNIHVHGDVYQGNALKVENIQINQGLSTSDLLKLLCESDSASLGALPDSRGTFAAQLSSQLRKFIPNRQTPFLLPDQSSPPHVYVQDYDEEFNKLSQKMVCDIEVDEEENLVVTPAELQTLETRFAEARTRCRSSLSDELLASQSERCQFYIKLSVVVEDALELPGIQMDDYSPQLVLYGKALEQSLRDNFYELFHKEPKLSIYSTYTQLEDQSSPDVFANKLVNQTLIGNYIFLMSAKRSYLANLCHCNAIQTPNQPTDNNSWITWWRNLEDDIFEARRIRNMADHADAVLSPRKENLELMCDLLFGTSTSTGLLSRSLVGKSLLQQIFPPAISFDVAQNFVGKECHMICRTVKRNGGLNGVTCEGGYPVNISPKRVLAYRNANMYENFDFAEKELVVSIIECKTQDNRDFFAAELVSVVSKNTN